MVAKRKTKSIKGAVARKAPVARSQTKRNVKTTSTPRGKIGSSFDDFLKSEGTYEETTALAIKRVLTWQIEEEMKEQKITKAKMADLMNTSRSHLDRLLDPNNDKVQLDTIQRAASALGKQVSIELS